MSSLKKLFLAILIMAPVFLFAAETLDSPFIEPDARPKEDITKAFKYFKNVFPNISIPKVLEVPFNRNSFSIPSFAVYNLTTSTFEPYLLSENLTETRGYAEAVGGLGSPANVNDGNYGTYLEFPVVGNNAANATINFRFDKPVTSSSMSLVLDNYVALPQTVSISAEVADKDYTVLAPVRPTGNNIVFPKTTSSLWSVSFTYIQPLRISEMKLNDQSVNQSAKRGLRFLAQPRQTYQIYFDADRYVGTSTKEAGDLSSNKDIVYFDAPLAILNPSYRPVDSDADSVPDLADNCVNVVNSDQKDSDNNGRGDVCEDYDRDGVVNAKDNCVDIPNVAQTDTDTDGVGDVCDTKDNRATERMPWLPWVGIGVAGVVIFGLFAVVLMHKKNDNLSQPPQQ